MIRQLLIMALSAAAPSVLSSAPAIAASFDCSQAGSDVEHMVCSDAEISRLDEALADAYRLALSAATGPGDLRAQQKQWLDVRRDTCDDKHCLRNAYRQRVGWLEGLGGRAAANGLSQDTLAAFVRMELNLQEHPFAGHARIKFAPIRSASENEAQRIAFAVSWVAGGLHLGIVDVSGDRPRMVSSERFECHCESIGTFQSERLVAAEPDFIVTEYIPSTGTCVAFVPLDILRVDEQGAFGRVWQGLTYSAGGPPAEAEVSDITFTYLRDGADRAILRSTRRVLCGQDDCFCEDGTLTREYVELFVWDSAAKRFRPAE